MAHPLKPEFQQLSQTAQQFQIKLESLVKNFLAYDFNEVESDVTSLCNQSRLLDNTLLCLLNSSAHIGRIYWKQQNRQQINSLNRSCATMSHLQYQLRILHVGAAEGTLCASGVCSLAVLWHRFVMSLKRTLNELETRPVRRKRSHWRHSMMNA